jgi:hypothetical protein
MSRMRVLLAGLLAVFAFGALTAASASALSWKVEKKELAAKATEALKETTTLAKAVTFAGDGIEVTCTKLAAKKAFIEGTAGGAAEALAFTGCTVPGFTSNCEVEKKEVKTKEVTAKLEAGVKITFAPKSGEEFTTLKVINKSPEICEVASEYKVTGAVTGNATKAASELKEQPLAFTATSGSTMKVDSQAATFTGEMDLALTSAKTWGAS